jgi:uncharacterized membrane protein SpoIIM required for sporulation
MVLESIINPAKMEKHPMQMYAVGFFYSTLGLLFALFLFVEEKSFAVISSIAAVFITTIPLVFVLMNTVKYEEEKDLCIHKETFLIKEHGKALSMIFFVFLGIVSSYTLWFVLLPDQYQTLFSYQIHTLDAIQQNISTIGDVINFSDYGGRLGKILLNNSIVLMICVVFSLLYGAGAMLVLTLNASVIGVAVGSKVKEYLAAIAFGSHQQMLYEYFRSSVSITFCYMFHGVFEISSYIVGALAGGIISVAVVNRDTCRNRFWHIIADSSDLIMLSVVLLILGALIEVYVTPVICH